MHIFVYRCYARALKLMPEVPSLWYDLGLNYYHQACFFSPMEGDQTSPSLLLEKAQQVTPRFQHNDSFAGFDPRKVLLKDFRLCSVFEKGYHDGQWESYLLEFPGSHFHEQRYATRLHLSHLYLILINYLIN